MARLIVGVRSIPEIDISKYFGDYEFLVVPKSLLHDDGKLVTGKNKYVILQELEHLSNLMARQTLKKIRHPDIMT